MKKKQAQAAIDILMAVSMPFLMAYSLIGERFHEVLGAAAGCLFIAHNVLNRWFYKTLFKGKYAPRRALTLVLDLALAACVALLMASGIILSTFVFAFVEADSLYSFARLAHLCAAYWAFVLMSLHAGMHVPAGRILNRMKGSRRIVLIALLLLACAFGAFSFVRNNFFGYLFLRTHFAFLDFESPLAFFFAQYVSVMVLFGTIGAGLGNLLAGKGTRA